MNTNNPQNNTINGSPKLRLRSGSVKVEGDGMESILQNLQSTLSSSPPIMSGFMGTAGPRINNIYAQRERQAQQKAQQPPRRQDPEDDLLSDSPSLQAMKPEERRMQLANLYSEQSPSNPPTMYRRPRMNNMNNKNKYTTSGQQQF